MHDVRKGSNPFSPLYPRWCKHGVGGGEEVRFSISKKGTREKGTRGERARLRSFKFDSQDPLTGTPRRSFRPGHIFLYDAAPPKLSKGFIALEGCEMSLDNTRGAFIFQFYFIPKTNKIFVIINSIVVNAIKKNHEPKHFFCWPKSCSPSFNSLFCSYTYSI